ncbi:hypothetical protein [Mycetohabitans sp. B46]|uniref:hypothetical protein n=1 Tax=Mycetohabitans sp. B46 TaxID=2772536 RepID=UPI00307CE5DC
MLAMLPVVPLAHAENTDTIVAGGGVAPRYWAVAVTGRSSAWAFACSSTMAFTSVIDGAGYHKPYGNDMLVQIALDYDDGCAERNRTDHIGSTH